MQYDKNFLLQLDQYREKDTYVKIISLDINDNPLEVIEGKITGGSVNVDGTSAVRRICSLTLVAPLENTIITDTYWCFNTKMKLQMGLKNNIDKDYPNIVWFDMGVYIITSFSATKSTNNISINIQGKDKMCRLNGDVGGNLLAQHDFGKIEIKQDNGDILIEKIPIKDIIYNAIKVYGQERDENIIINDLDDYGYELWEYIGQEPMYYLKNTEQGNIDYLVVDPTTKIKNNTLSDDFFMIAELEEFGGKYYSTNTLDTNYNNKATIIQLEEENTDYYIIKINSDSTAGYKQIKLVYNTELILNVNETIESLLSKLRNMLGNFEYFYDLQGRFVFQKKKDYIQELWSTSSGALLEPILTSDLYSYEFNNEELFSNISISPDIGKVKNDFSVWGTKTTALNDNLPIHARCAIDKKPVFYYSPWNNIKEIYNNSPISENIKNKEGYIKIIYSDDSEEIFNLYFEIAKVGENVIHFTIKENLKLKQIIWYNKNIDKEEEQKYILINKSLLSGKYKLIYSVSNIINETFNIDNIKITKGEYQDNKYYASQAYEKLSDKDNKLLFDNENKQLYTIEKVYDWRELIYQMARDYEEHNSEEDFYIKIEQYNPNFIKGKTGYEQYYTDMLGFWRQLYSPYPEENIDGEEYYGYTEGDINSFWNKKVHSDPYSLVFWFDFIDIEGEINQYSVSNIGIRTKAFNDNSVTSIYYQNTPEVQFKFVNEDTKQINTTFTPIQINENDVILFNKSSQGNSALSKINELIQEGLGISQGLNLTCIPIYYLQPNTRIKINNTEYDGDYVIDKLSYNLNYNGTMSIAANKILKQFI